ncbi:MAG: type II secretion system F family protein [Candidatus Aenigmarchaeota archaeon]|nr:type II secretion system F family protein [Candidatus Aenigmarchaeota archaeon]
MEKKTGFLKDKNKRNFVYVLMASLFSAVILQIIKFYFIDILTKTVSSLFDVFSVFVLVVPISVLIYNARKREKERERIFPIFLKDIVEGIRGGMSLPLAIDNTSLNNYGVLTEDVKKLASKISWGIPFERAFLDFSRNTKSKVIRRSIATIIEVYRSGGKIADVLDSVGNSAFEIEFLRKERESTISSQVIRGYLIFFIFVLVLVGMLKFLVPVLSVPMSTGIEVSTDTPPIDTSKYNVIFLHIAIIEGIFTGLSVGKLAGGSMNDGVYHAVILGLSGYIMLIFFI